MKRIKKRTFSGVVCEQTIYYVSDRAKNIKTAEPRLRFKTDEERAEHREGISKRNHTRLFNENFSPQSLYSTLTFDDEHEIHTFQEAKKIRDNYIRRLKYAFPDSVIFAYLGRGKSTNRIHMHMVSNGIPESAIIEKWGQGEIRRIEHLREHNYYEIPGKGKIDHGQDYTGLANYLYDHWKPEQGGHRWKQTKNVKIPDREDIEEIKRNYSEDKPPITPKGYILVDKKCTTYGYQYFKYVLKPPPLKRHSKAL
jgi:hypothetical protein